MIMFYAIYSADLNNTISCNVVPFSLCVFPFLVTRIEKSERSLK